MNANSHYLIADTQSQGGFFAKLLHVTALNAIVLFRHGFGHNFIGPLYGFLGYWAGSVLLSLAFAATTGNRLTLSLKVAILVLFMLHYFSAKCNLWMSNAPVRTWQRAPRNADYCGKSWISFFKPNDEWRIFLFFEPMIAIATSGLAAVVDTWLSLTLLISAVSMTLKNWIAYNKFCVDTTGKTSQYTYAATIYQAAQGALGGVGTHYRPPPQFRNTKKPLTKRGRVRLQTTALKLNQPSQTLGAVAPSVSVPGANSVQDAEYAKLLNRPFGGFVDQEQLKKHRNIALHQYQPQASMYDRLSYDEKLKAKEMSCKINDAYEYFKAMLNPPIGHQSPLK